MGERNGKKFSDHPLHESDGSELAAIEQTAFENMKARMDKLRQVRPQDWRELAQKDLKALEFEGQMRYIVSTVYQAQRIKAIVKGAHRALTTEA